MKKYIAIPFSLLLLACFHSSAQSQKDLELFTREPRNIVSLPVDYCSIFPAAQANKWDKDYNFFSKYMTHAVQQSQVKQLFKDGAADVSVTTTSAMPHVQLDTGMLVYYRRDLLGYWRAITIREVFYSDSCSYEDNSVHREAKQLSENKRDDIIAVVTEDKFKLFLKEPDRSRFKVIDDSKYFIEAKRYLMEYKMLQSAAVPTLIGIDNEGRLILNSYKEIERTIAGKYSVHETVMQQLVLEKLNVSQLHYDKDKKQMGAGHHIAPN